MVDSPHRQPNSIKAGGIGSGLIEVSKSPSAYKSAKLENSDATKKSSKTERQ